MTEQTMLQVRIDNKLKEEAAAVFEQIGIDIPTAVRMFFKAAVREQRLPFSTDVSAASKEKTDAEKLMAIMKSMVLYEPPIMGDDAEVIAVLPLEYGQVPASMFVQLVTKVPAGKITCWEDVFKALGEIYGMEVKSLPNKTLPNIDSNSDFIPYWRVVSNRGILGTGRGGGKEHQRESLLKEGVPVVQRGNVQGSYKVENYRDYMFDFSKLKILKTY